MNKQKHIRNIPDFSWQAIIHAQQVCGNSSEQPDSQTQKVCGNRYKQTQQACGNSNKQTDTAGLW
jgi:hypothetical protein